ncbi:MAG: hypothetical protein R2834_15835 [Rhodothermales bacterium]
MTLVDNSSAASTGALRYFVFIVCICVVLFFFLVVRLASGLTPEIYYDPPVKPVYRAQATVPAQVDPTTAAAPLSVDAYQKQAFASF